MKNSPDILIEIIVKLFNVILDSEHIPSDWCLDIIKPIFKNKGDPRSPSNYRGITILSCLGKLFTSCINTRLTSYSKSCDIIGNEQAGFRQGFSTADHIFFLKSLIDLYLFKKKRLYCCFVDYNKAFDTVNRAALWSKLLAKGIGGKLIKSIYSMYNNAKSCISMSGKTSGYFACETGVRQGENLSPLLFPIFLSDLRDYLSTKYNGLSFINNNISDLLNDINLDTYLKLYILLYADDTVILAESPKELKLALDAMDQYWTIWKLKINVSKTKVLIFSRGNVRNRPEFTFGNVELEIVRDYQYLGLIFNYNGKFIKAKEKLFEKDSRAMFSLVRKARCLFFYLMMFFLNCLTI